MQKPKKLEKGDRIGIISPATATEKRSDLIRAVETLEDWGYKVILGKNLNKTRGLVAGTEEERAADFNDMFRRDDVDAVFVAQGGYGSAQIINHVDFEAVKASPKIFTGFSDITSLHLALNKLAGLVTFHGPGISRFNSDELTDYTKASFLSALTSEKPLGDIKKASDKTWLNVINPGSAEGELIGGNLTLICASLGTPYEIETKGKILLIEDVDMEPWMMDHMLSHLRNAGKLDQAAGFIVGYCKNCVPYTANPGYHVDMTLEDVLDYYLKPLKVPAFYGLPLGHTKDIATLPLGVAVRVDADEQRFRVLESGIKS